MGELGAGASGRGLLEDVVEEPSGDDFVWFTVTTQQACNLDRVGDEWRVVDLAVRIGVANAIAACAIGSPANWCAARRWPAVAARGRSSLWMLSVTAVTS
jgi:hypothetical protein